MTENEQAEFIATAKARFKQAEEDEKDIRAEAEKDLRFVSGDQWDEAVRQARVQAKRPVLTFNRLPTYVQQIANESRQNKLEIKFAPTDDEATDDTAEVIEGLARHIQYESEASIAYETAGEYAVACSFGFYRFLTGYCDDDSFDQELKVTPVFDPFQVYGVLVPSIFGHAVPWAFVIEDMPKEQYKREYGKTDAAMNDFDAGILGSDWVSDEKIRIAEYWYIEYEKQTLILKSDGSVVIASKSMDLAKVPEENRRTVQKPKVKFCKMNGMEVLPGSETTWQGSIIPIIPILGKQLIVKGKPKLFSLIRFQREPQQLINYAKTRIAETLATSPVSPFIGPVGFMKGREQQWRDLNTIIIPAIEYNYMDDASGKPLPPPARQTFEPPIASLSEFVAQEVDDLKSIVGIFDQSLGEGTNDQSGLAIGRRQQQSSITNFHFIDNYERGLKKGAPVISEMIKPIYGKTARMIRILGEDETPKIVRINQEYQGKNHDLSKGKYALIANVGRSFSSKRMESFDMMGQILQGQPQLMLMIGDIFFKNSDTAGADQMSERFKRIIQMSHPGLIDNDATDPASQLQTLQAKLAQLTQAHNALNAYAQNLEKEKEGKVIEQQTKVQIAQAQELSRQEIVKLQEATKLAVAQMNASKDAHETIAQTEIKAFDIMHGAAHEAATQAADQLHERNMAQLSHQQALEQGQQAAENQSAQSAQDASQAQDAAVQQATLNPPQENANAQ